MLRASASLQLTSMRKGVHINANNHLMRMQQRNYIFLPASFQELQQMILEAWSCQQEKRRTVWVKLWQGPKELNDVASSSTRRKRFRRSLSNKTKNFRMRQHKSYLSSKRKFQNAKLLLRQHATTRMNSLQKSLWEYYPLHLTEPAHPDWFDSDGYPIAVRNSYGRFVNPWNSKSTNGMQSLWLFLKWRVERFYNSWLSSSSTTVPLPPDNNKTSSQLAFQSTPPPSEQIRCTWLGHSTTLVEMEGYTILTDPVFSKRASPIQAWPFGAARHEPPPCLVKDLPFIDVCVISHDHYDHLDQDSVLQLKDKVQYWAVPLGMSEWLQDSCDISPKSILEMTWWQSTSLTRQGNGSLQVVKDDNDKSGLQLTCAPAQHWCGRNMWDRNLRLWCSWVVASDSLKYFFAGDTALPESFPLHRQIGDRLGPFDVAALPIGAYAPSYFMKVSHVHPSEAAKIHQHLRVTKSMAIHWGTFNLSEEPNNEPPLLLAQAADKAGIDFVAVSQGDCIVGPPLVEKEEMLLNDESSEETEDEREYWYG